MKLLRILGWLFLFSFLTILTQIGGLILLLLLPVFYFINLKIKHSITRNLIKITFSILFYNLITFLVIPMIAAPFGRVPLPVFSNKYVKPANIGYCLLNRHYVKPALKEAMERSAEEMNIIFPGTKIYYLDANFPFWNEFPLLPHLSHDDGKKLDISFFYMDKKSGKPSNSKPSFTGYGVFESPREEEINQTDLCKSKGYWQYDINRFMGLIHRKHQFLFDEKRTKTFIQILTRESQVHKILIEPHLKTRMKLTNNKIRFHGCQAARHDDHLHIQIK
ncbi:MAG: hypothetical protein SFU99_15565 [Saprospiraceae bacterium]|nr:hypothetical protein [Saprospiraceae bacterium]